MYVRTVRTYVCMYVCTHVCMYMYVCICMYMYVYVCICMYVYVCMYVRTYVCMGMVPGDGCLGGDTIGGGCRPPAGTIYAHLHVCMHLCVRMYVCAHEPMYVCMICFYTFFTVPVKYLKFG